MSTTKVQQRDAGGKEKRNSGGRIAGARAGGPSDSSHRCQHDDGVQGCEQRPKHFLGALKGRQKGVFRAPISRRSRIAAETPFRGDLDSGRSRSLTLRYPRWPVCKGWPNCTLFSKAAVQARPRRS